MKNLVWLLAFISLAAAGAIKIDADQFRSPDHTKVWTPPSSTTTLIGTDTNNDLTNKTLDKLVSTSEQVNAVATGANAVVTTPTSLVVQLTNVSLTSIDGITAPANNQIVILKNKTGANVTVNNETGVNTTYRIKTGTGANLTLSTDASIILAYSTTDNRWQVVGGSGSGGGGLSAWVTAHGYLTGDIVIESNKIYKALSDHTSGTFATDLAGGKWVEVSAMDGVDLSTNQTIGGIKTFSSTIVGSVNGNAATVTTNANLTGPITSTGNATAVASQTGTGSKFVMDTSPTLVTPVLGVATATSINGTTIPTSKTLQDKDALTAKGDLYVATAATTTARQAVGSNKQVLMADSAQTNGIKWADSQVLSKSETDGADVDTIKFQTPKAQLTTTATGVRRIETGNRNVLQDPNAEASATPWGVYADAAGTSPVDGTGGSPSVTVANSNTSPLEGAQSLVFTKDAANRQGQGMSLAFTIDAADKTKVLRVDFDYQISSGTYADDDMSCWVYDVTNSAMIQPAPYKIKNVTGIEPFAMEFQATTSTSYRLICHVASTSASAYTVKFDNFSLGRGPKVYSTSETTFSAQVSSAGVVSGENKDWINGNCSVASTAVYTCTFTSGIFTVAPNCTVSAADNGSNAYSAKTGTTTSSTSMVFTTINSNSGNVTALPSVINCQKSSTDYANATAGRVSSSEADTRVVSLKANATATQAVTANVTDISYSTVVKDSHAAWNGSVYTVPIPGDYYVSAVMADSGATTIRPAIYVNGSINTQLLTGVSGEYGGGSMLIANLKAGDTISTRLGQSITLSAGRYISISKISGPSQVQASETVAADYYISSGQSIPNNSATVVQWNAKVFDTHNAMNTSTGVYTCPISGKYQVSATNIGPSSGTGQEIAYVYKNGSLYASGTSITNSVNQYSVTANRIVPCLAGETLSSAYFQSSGSSHVLSSNSSYNYISILRVGNY